MLKINDLRVNYGGIEAVKGISFEVPEKSIVTLIGANGAGKSTTLRAIAGLVKASAGSIQFDGTELLGMDTPDIVSRGITLVPEGRRVFPDMTVIENIKIGAYLRTDSLDHDIEWVYSLFPRLKERCWQLAGTLSGGEQQRVAIARALINDPEVLLADEPTGNLDSFNTHEIMRLLEEINQRGTTVIVVTHSQEMVDEMNKRIITMERGSVISDVGGYY